MIGLVPGLPSPQLDPDLVLFVFLPPLLYSAGVSASAYELRASARPILFLATGLVLVTIGAVAAVAHAALGIAVEARVRARRRARPDRPGERRRRAQSPRRERADADDHRGRVADQRRHGADRLQARDRRRHGSRRRCTSASRSSLDAAAGIAIGLAAGWVFSHLRSFVTDPSLDVTLSVITPFVAYVPAERIDVSGVLAVVVAGVYTGIRSPDVIEAGTRLRTLAFWQSTTFLIDGLLFLLVGLQVPTILDRIQGGDALDAGRRRAARHAHRDGREEPRGGARRAVAAPARRRRADRDRLERDARRHLAGRRAGDPGRRRFPAATSSCSSPTARS